MDFTAALTEKWSLTRVFEQLRLKENVEGILVIGSLATGTMNTASDYDLVIVLRSAPRPWFVGVTTIEGRATDLVFVSSTAVQSVATLAEPVAYNHELAPIIRWLSAGAIRFDRHDYLGRLQQKLRQGTWIQPVDAQARYEAWFAINYNLTVAERMAQSENELYRRTLLIRMAVYGHSDIWFGYFTIRQIAWEGDKAAVNYLLDHDVKFLELFENFLAASTAVEKLKLYRRAAALATRPLGSLWPVAMTVINDSEARTLWQELMD
jgi:hypothetical protein